LNIFVGTYRSKRL